jgi:hypothetical protein
MMGWAGHVPITAEDIGRANDCAADMIRSASATGARTRFGDNSDTRPHFVGALGEIAFARFMDVPWECHPQDFNLPDVAGYEVRTVAPDARMSLKVKANDVDARKVALVLLLAAPSLPFAAAAIVGWATVGEIRAHGTQRDPGRMGAPAIFLDDFRILSRSFA